jgi:hypothetical protein
MFIDMCPPAKSFGILTISAIYKGLSPGAAGKLSTGVFRNAYAESRKRMKEWTPMSNVCKLYVFNTDL